ncbi:MAG: PglZ domain-containing protein [Candidatus Hodarchaeota archaeon]
MAKIPSTVFGWREPCRSLKLGKRRGPGNNEAFSSNVMTKKQTFTDILGDRLGRLPEAARTVIALDPRRILTVPSPFLDASNRDWDVFVYNRNDIDLRAGWKSIKGKDKRFLIIAVGSSGNGFSGSQIDLSYIPDLLDEAEEIIDCSPPGLLRELFEDPLPPDLFEEPLLSHWAENLDRFLVQLKKYQKVSGKKSVLNRYDVTAVCLSTTVPAFELETIADLPQETLARLLFYLRAVVGNRLNDIELELLKDVVLGPAPDILLQAWCGLTREELLRFLYLGLAAVRYAVPRGVGELERLGLLGFEIDELGDSPDEVLNVVRKDLDLIKTITSEAERSSSIIADAGKLVGRFKFGSYLDGFDAFRQETCPAVVYCLGTSLIKWLLSSKEGRKALGLWYREEDPYRDRYPKTPFTTKALRLRELMTHLSWLEFTLGNAPPPPSNLLDLINTYHSANLHLLEMTVAQVREIIRLLKDEDIGDIVGSHMEGIQSKVDSVISGYDHKLGDIITSDWSGYTNFQRLNTRTLRDLIQAGAPRKERVWIIILDGMRLDSWDRFVWPRLRESFELEGDRQLYLATLPTYTDISRVSFLAGKLPVHWRDYRNDHTSDHNILLSRHLGLGRDESKKKLKILGRVEERTEQTELDFDASQYRVMIFNLSDDWIHHEQGSLVRVNDIIQDKFEKLVLPEITYSIRPEDIVVVTSDHGFIELRKEFMHKVNGVPNGDVTYRYIRDCQYDRGVKVTYDHRTRWTVALGHEWFQREKSSGRKSRYSHGGISMAEMVIPAVRLKKRTRKEVILVLMIDEVRECAPGDSVNFGIHVSNQGTVTTNVSLTCRLAGRLIAEEELVLPGGASYEWPVAVVADPKATQVVVSAEYTVPERKKEIERRQVVIPIKEAGARIEIDTSALDDFEDI